MGVKTRTVTEVTDDLDGTELPEGTKPVKFNVAGQWREIYLSDANAEKFTKAVEPFVAASTRINTGSAGSRSTDTTTPSQYRSWATEQGIPVPARGRIPQTVKDAYHAAH